MGSSTGHGLRLSQGSWASGCDVSVSRTGAILNPFPKCAESAAVQIRMNWVDQDILRICMVLLYIYIFFHDQSAVNNNRPLHQITFAWTLRHA
jgi:hypothetical protein